MAMAQRGLHATDLAAIGITNQRETTVVWNRKTGAPVANALVWQDTRVRLSAPSSSRRMADTNCFAHKTGLPLTTYFSGLKIRWILEQCSRRVGEHAEAGDFFSATSIPSWCGT